MSREEGGSSRNSASNGKGAITKIPEVDEGCGSGGDRSPNDGGKTLGEGGKSPGGSRSPSRSPQRVNAITRKLAGLRADATEQEEDD